MKIIHVRWWVIGTLTCAAIALAFSCWFYASKLQPDEKVVLAPEDEVYEAVVRDMVTPAPGDATVKYLVFADRVIFERSDGSNIQSCKENAFRHSGLQENKPLPFNTVADKMYRVFTGGWYDVPPGAAAIQDFLNKFCNGGPISRTFRTDVPRAFIGADSVHFDDLIIENGPPTLKQMYPGATGIISFSRVGFDSTMREAMVIAAYACGGLCGTGWRYVLRKKRGAWEVVSKSIVWVS